MFDSSIPYNEKCGAFIQMHLNDDPKSLLLKYHGRDLGFDINFAVLQIESRRKTSHKLSPFLENPDFLFPTSLSAEQASNSAIATFHASLISSGSTLLDMTAGLGIDAMTSARNASAVTAIEMDKLKSEVLKHNVAVMGLGNFSVINSDSVEWLRNSCASFDTIFIDPARRDSSNSRLYGLGACQPDVISIQQLLKSRCRQLLIKGSPLLDITQTLYDMKDVTSIRAICVAGECKEVLIEIGECDGKVLKEAIDLNEDGSIRTRFSYSISLDKNDTHKDILYAQEDGLKSGMFLYEPNAALMKLAPWTELQNRYPNLIKLSPSSHLFISETRHDDFPGRVLIVEGIISNKDKKRLKGERLNVVVRNYPMTAPDLRKKLGLLEGKDRFLYGSRISNPVLILASKS